MKTEIKMVLVAIAIVSLISLLQLVLNAKKNRRIRQFPIIFLSIVMSLFGVAFFVKIVGIVSLRGSVDDIIKLCLAGIGARRMAESFTVDSIWSGASLALVQRILNC